MRKRSALWAILIMVCFGLEAQNTITIKGNVKFIEDGFRSVSFNAKEHPKRCWRKLRSIPIILIR